MRHRGLAVLSICLASAVLALGPSAHCGAATIISAGDAGGFL